MLITSGSCGTAFRVASLAPHPKRYVTIMFRLLCTFLFLLPQAVYAQELLNWARAIGSDEGKPVSIRFREAPPKNIKIQDYPNLVIIRWDYVPENDSGMPGTKLFELMADVENAFAEKIENKNNAFLTVSFLGNGVREWQIYTKSTGVLAEDFNQAVSHFQELPLELATELDPNWEAYFAFAHIQE